MLRYHNITKDDMLNGDGLRVVLWTAGCEHHCNGCQNPITWDINGGLEFDSSARKELYEALEKPYVSGITFSGGDPLLECRRTEMERLICDIRNKFKDKTIWMYTGYEWNEVKNLSIIKLIDVLIDGKFVESKKDIKLHWRGSSNQHVIDVQKSLKANKIILYCS